MIQMENVSNPAKGEAPSLYFVKLEDFAASGTDAQPRSLSKLTANL